MALFSNDERDALQDLHAVLATPEGFRTFARLVLQLGYAAPVAGTVESAAVHNIAINLMDSIALADREAHARISETIILERISQEE